MKSRKVIIFVMIVVGIGSLIYKKDDIIKFYSSLNKQVQTQVQNFQKTDVGQIVAQVAKQIVIPPPLNIGGAAKQVVLLQSRVIAETNLQRQENGDLTALKENTKLDEAASAKANDMFLDQYFEHTSPSGVDPGKLVQGHRYDYIVAGENLILGNFSSEKEVVQDWMNSPGHRANILNNRFTEIGVAIIKGTYKRETVWIGVQEFGLPLSSCTQPDANLRSQIDPQKIQLENMSSQINDLRTEVDNADSRSPAYRQMVDDYNQLVVQYNSLAEQLKEVIANYNSQVNDFNGCVAGK